MSSEARDSAPATPDRLRMIQLKMPTVLGLKKSPGRKGFPDLWILFTSSEKPAFGQTKGRGDFFPLDSNRTQRPPASWYSPFAVTLTRALWRRWVRESISGVPIPQQLIWPTRSVVKEDRSTGKSSASPARATSAAWLNKTRKHYFGNQGWLCESQP